MQIVCLDLEGVLIPEIWIAFAQKSGLTDLIRTTRDEPDYDKLMRFRLRTLADNGLKLPDIEHIVSQMAPLPGAREFLDALRSRFQVVILSDTYYEFAGPLMRQLGWPTLFCHRLVVAADGSITDYQLRLPEPKRKAVEAFKALNFGVIAVGDSYNDTTMLAAADVGFFLHAPPAIAAQFPAFAVHGDYSSLLASICSAAQRLESAPC